VTIIGVVLKSEALHTGLFTNIAVVGLAAAHLVAGLSTPKTHLEKRGRQHAGERQEHARYVASIRGLGFRVSGYAA
jgi:hypothetical protein